MLGLAQWAEIADDAELRLMTFRMQELERAREKLAGRVAALEARSHRAGLELAAVFRQWARRAAASAALREERQRNDVLMSRATDRRLVASVFRGWLNYVAAVNGPKSKFRFKKREEDDEYDPMLVRFGLLNRELYDGIVGDDEEFNIWGSDDDDASLEARLQDASVFLRAARSSVQKRKVLVLPATMPARRRRARKKNDADDTEGNGGRGAPGSATEEPEEPAAVPEKPKPIAAKSGSSGAPPGDASAPHGAKDTATAVRRRARQRRAPPPMQAVRLAAGVGGKPQFPPRVPPELRD